MRVMALGVWWWVAPLQPEKGWVAKLWDLGAGGCAAWCFAGAGSGFEIRAGRLLQPLVHHSGAGNVNKLLLMRHVGWGSPASWDGGSRQGWGGLLRASSLELPRGFLAAELAQCAELSLSLLLAWASAALTGVCRPYLAEVGWKSSHQHHRKVSCSLWMAFPSQHLAAHRRCQGSSAPVFKPMEQASLVRLSLFRWLQR